VIPQPANAHGSNGGDGGSRLQSLVEAIANLAGAEWALLVSRDGREILACCGITREDVAAASIAALALEQPDFRPDTGAVAQRRVWFAGPVVDSGGVDLGALALGGGASALPPPETLKALEAAARLAGITLAMELERGARDQERATLLAELDHRVKNVLAAVQSLAAQSARRAVSLDGFLKAFSGRLKAMASAQELLTATRWRGAELHHLASAELGGLAPGQTRWEGPELFLNPRAANAMSLALHELAINAAKYGALSTPQGQVEVRWRRIGDGFELEWTERGGPAIGVPSRRGFGGLLIEEVTGRELGGSAQIEFRPGGVRAVLRGDAGALAEREPRPVQAAAAPVEGAGASVGAASPGPRDVRGLKVLIVEDAALLALELEHGLKEAGAEIVGCAAELDEAMGLLDRPIEAAVLDANLNGVSVRPVAEALAARGTPFLFATGYGENRGAPEGFGVPIIRKPYDITQILAALAQITGRAA
jgi:two-component sensor histidine kinase/CheY-like chemotaxis protein